MTNDEELVRRQRLRAIEDRVEAASLGPWERPTDPAEHSDDVAVFQAHAMDDIMWLLNEVERLRGDTART